MERPKLRILPALDIRQARDASACPNGDGSEPMRKDAGMAIGVQPLGAAIGPQRPDGLNGSTGQDATGPEVQRPARRFGQKERRTRLAVIHGARLREHVVRSIGYRIKGRHLVALVHEIIGWQYNAGIPFEPRGKVQRRVVLRPQRLVRDFGKRGPYAAQGGDIFRIPFGDGRVDLSEPLRIFGPDPRQAVPTVDTRNDGKLHACEDSD